MDEQELTGRELDAAVAEKVMGWKWWAGPSWWNPAMHRGIFPREPLHIIGGAKKPAGDEPLFSDWDRGLPHYSSTWEGMGLVVEEMERRKWKWQTGKMADGCFGLFIEGGDDFWGSGATAPEAVARAALRALEKGAGR